MAMYGDMDIARAGMLDGLDHEVESKVAVSATQFGDPLFVKDGDETFAYLPKTDVATVLLSADLVASNVITSTVTLNGVAFTAVANTYATAHADSMTAHIALIEALTGVTCVAGTTNRAFVVTGESYANVSITTVVTLGASQATASITYTSTQKFGGVANISHRSYIDSKGEYPAGDQVNVMNEGRIWVRVPSGLTLCANKDAYVISNSDNADYKKFTATATSNISANAKFKNNPVGGLALVYVDAV